LSTELKNTEGVQLVDARKGAGADPFQEGLERARKLVDEAKDQRKTRKFRLAEESLTKAVAEYKASAAGLAEVGELVDTYALLSAVQFNTGRDEQGHASLNIALAMAPARDLPLAATSALFNRVVTESKRAIQLAPRGMLLVESTPPGAAVTIDGVLLGNAPLQVKDVPAGLHVWKVSLPSGETTGGLVEVAAAKPSKVSGQTQAKDPESRILATLAQNKLDAEVVAAAKEHAKAAESDLVLFGALSKEGKGLALDCFLLQAATGELRRLPHLTFDTELLSAGMEFFNLASQIKERGAKIGEPARVPGPVSLQTVASGVKLAEAQYGVQAGKDLSLDADPGEGPKDTGPRTPLEPKKRVPLKKNR
ncbi:MAG: PEGA domain-containing protein, partial [Myxococcaceae bacterium]